MEHEHLFFAGFRALPAWQRVAIVGASLVLSPWIVLVLTVTALSLLPFLLLGTFEGSLGPKPVRRELGHAARDVRARTNQFFA